MKEVLVRRPAQHIATLALAATLAGTGLTPTLALAATYEELQQQVEESTAAYEQAMDHVDQVQGQIEANEEKISKIEAELPAQRERAASSLRTLYKMQQSGGGLVDLLLSSEDFNSFIATLTYLERIQSKNFNELEELASLDAELREAKDTLKANKALADQELETARTAQQDALDAREAVVRQAEEQAAAERAAAEQALQRAAEAAANNETITTASGNEVKVTAPEENQSPTPTLEEPSKPEEPKTEGQKPVEQPSLNSSRDAFIANWAPRIDAYLAGSAMSGQGRVFAEAAWDYNVDPRLSPAISCIESGKGAVCFHPHNAWGWGQVSWPDWPTAIRGHVSGLSAGYGYTLTPSGAEMYAGMAEWEYWYSLVLGEMNRI